MNTKSYCLALCCLLTVSATYAENIRKKVKNAAGIEVTYQSSYKGKTAPGQLLMKVMGNEVSLTQIPPKEEADKKKKYASRTKLPSSEVTSITRLVNPTSVPNSPMEESFQPPLRLSLARDSRK